MVKQNRIAASETTAGRPGLPSYVGSQVISLTPQISSDPPLRRDTVSLDQCVVRLPAEDGLLMRSI